MHVRPLAVAIVFVFALLSFAWLGGCGRPPASTPRAPVARSRAVPADLERLAPGAEVGGFVASAVYVDDDGTARGARFVHARTGFVFDYLRIESAPQGFVYVTTIPSSDGGEAHTQEHLLLGRGNKGRYLGNVEHAMLARSSAFTAQYRTVYHFHTVGGVDTFWPLLRTELDALLHPDYSDGEVRREVRDFGVAKGPDGALSLAEKGTVYNEMVNRFDDAGDPSWFGLARLVYGEKHPIALVSGGTPEGIRELTPARIKAFHAAHYQLGNMGMIASFPSSAPLGSVLDEVAKVLDGFARPAGAARRFMTARDLPPAAGAPAGSLRIVDYPYSSSEHPGPMRFAWPASHAIDPIDALAREAFAGAFASGAGSTLYAALVDRTTRNLDVGATDVWSYVSTDPGRVLYIGLNGVAAAHADEASLRAVRGVVLARLRDVAALPDGSKELAAFQERYRARLVESQRGLDKFLDTPPQFGSRSIGDTWLTYLEESVHAQPGFRLPLRLSRAFARAFALADGKTNPWRDLIGAWGMLDEPYGVVARPSPSLRKERDDALRSRLDAELERLKRGYGVEDADEVIRRRAAEVARGDEEIARAEAGVPTPPFLADPPMTGDDALSTKRTTVRGVPVVASTFDSMKSATIGLALRLDAVPDDLLPYVAILPSLLRDVGVVRDGKAIPYDEVGDRLRREVLGVDVYFDVRFSKNRAELLFRASGNDVDETRRAIGWLRDFLTSPDWRVENLPRVRDVVAAETKALRDTPSSYEEAWVEDIAAAYWRQDQPHMAHAGAFFTRAHDAFRLSWQLEGGAESKKVAAFFRGLAGAGASAKGDRAALVALARALEGLGGGAANDARPSKDLAAYIAAARALPPSSRPQVEKAGRDLGALLSDLPDASIAADWRAICVQLAGDSARAPTDTLATLAKTLAAVRHASLARVWMVGSSRHQQAVRGDLDALLGALDATPATPIVRASTPRIVARVRARGEVVVDATVAALVDPNRSNASLVSAAPSAAYDATTDDALIDYLAANVFSGTGGHSFYKRIWGAGLAYSGYVYSSPYAGRFTLYSDRAPDIAQVLRFVDGVVRDAPELPRVVDYTVTTAFGSRVADSYESRAQTFADDLVSGAEPDRVRAFRARLLELRKRPGLAAAIRARLVPVYAKLIPSLAPPSPRAAGSMLFAVGSEAQVGALERQLRATAGERSAILRIYPRDFW